MFDDTLNGGVIDIPDSRDYNASDILGADVGNLPDKFKMMTKADDQGNSVKCTTYTAYHVGRILNEIEHKKPLKGLPDIGWTLQQQFGTFTKNGDSLQTGCKSIKKNGLHCDPTNYPILNYAKIEHSDIKSWLARGYPIITCADVTKTNFKDAKFKGVYGGKDGEKITAHAFALVGYETGYLWALNSYGCYSDDTEVLTSKGWQLFKNITLNDKFATFSKNKEIEYQKANKIFDYDYNGEMYRFKNTKYDLLVTPNHNMVVTKEGEDDIIEARNLQYNSKKPYKIYTAIPNDSKKDVDFFYLPSVIRNGNQCPPLQIKMDIWLEFLGYYLGDGWTCNSLQHRNCHLEKGQDVKTFMVGVAAEKERKRKQVKEILSKMPFAYCETKKGFVIQNKQLNTYLSKLGKASFKYIPKEFKNLNSRQLLILIEAMLNTDGTQSEGKFCYYTVSPRLVDDFQEICLKAGYGTSVRKYTPDEMNQGKEEGSPFMNKCDLYHINVRKQLIHNILVKPEIIEYSGKVYCVEVPNHTLVIRRKSKVTICGNSTWGFFKDGTFKIKDTDVVHLGSCYILYDAEDIKMIFKDVSEKAPSAEAIKFMLDKKLMLGYDSEKILDAKDRFFCPEKALTRGEFAELYYRIFKTM